MQRKTMPATRTLAVLSMLLFLAGQVAAREYEGDKSAGKPSAKGAKASGCSPSTTVTQLWVNNVRCLIETGGNMWQNRSAGRAAYEVPATSAFDGPKCLFAGALWMGGLSPDNQLKLAAVRFRQVGNDFWPGPLTVNGDASITPELCAAFDRVWRAGKRDALRHQAYFLCLESPDCDVASSFPEGYQIPQYFFDWPAESNNPDLDVYLAPFVDWDGDGAYDPTQGDMPDYDLDGDADDCKNKFRTDPVPLFGDSTIWWVFNDKGNAHTESGGQPIGMEIRAQAFAFATNDEVNNMSFYNYVLINQGTQTLLNTYFGQWVDADLGNPNDDYVGCDVQRGLGYCYNGDNNDETTSSGPGYGVQPPAVGVDFFEGPFKDYDGIDNPLTLNYDSAITFAGIPYKGIGIGYGDGVVDNERFGMRAFLYHNNDGTVTGDPSIAIQYYNYLRAIWKDNSPMLFGGNGHFPTDDPNQDLPSFYMFPGDSDPVGWGTGGIPQAIWTEETAGNQPADRRFIQSAGPFTLEPGAYNNITVGVVFARASGGGPFESVERVRRADDKAQALFDNCFKILNGPDAPNLTIQELDQELILFITNPVGSNNFNESYEELDPTIPEDASDRFYRFQGYEIYQLRDATVTVTDIRDANGNLDPNVARLVAQCDIKDGVGLLYNFIYNEQMGVPVPTLMVVGQDKGVVHSIRITEDKFSNTGNPKLVNFKSYYFLALAYGYNNWENYNANDLTGQAFPYKSGRKSASGSIRSVLGIPHKPDPTNGGTTLNASFGDQFELTRQEGNGNGGLKLDLTQASVDAILNSPTGRQDVITYKTGFGPVDIKVVDPLNVPAADFELWFQDTTLVPTWDPLTYTRFNDAFWMLVKVDGDPTPDDTVRADRIISIRNEQLITSIINNWGISVTIEQTKYTGDFTEPLEATITYADPSKAWYAGIPDQETQTPFNWIRSGTATEGGLGFPDFAGKDDEELYEAILGGTWAPWPLMGDTIFQPCATSVINTRNLARINQTTSALVVFTPDKSKWTRCAVLEATELPSMSEGGSTAKLFPRPFPSRDKNGLKAGDSGYNDAEGTLNGAQPTGMSWFPGYAIELETGERLNMAFSEDSFWGGTRGRDMIWNPTDQVVSNLGQALFAGSHWIYVFRNERRTTATDNRMPQYEPGQPGQYLIDNLTSSAGRTRVFRAVNWVGSAALMPGMELLPIEQGLIPTEMRVVLSVNKPYYTYVNPYAGYQPEINPARNQGKNLYTFSTRAQATQFNQLAVAESACDLIGVVPNPYYAFSGYETSRLDNRVKFVNLPQVCTISIFNVSGTLVRQFSKDNSLTFLDWDLRNQTNVPIAGGVYICHIEVPGVCERVVKWFGVLRPVDLQNF
ncbi:MAG: T9SS C-terminal target domain-containing protein [Flavobacteriales bacterium]|nr:T9SS C-terminal target domain-containing protein [Flavobacteriales bacterium]